MLATALLVASCGRSPFSDPASRATSSALLVPGVSRQLAELRAATISNLRYEIFLSIPDAKNDPITGAITARFELADVSQPLIFDFAQAHDHVLGVALGGTPIDFGLESEHIVIDPSSLAEGPIDITIDFVAGDGPLNRNDEFLYTLFVPARARVALPIFDQPDLKARYRLRLELPTDWQAVSNGAVESQALELQALESQAIEGDRALLSFAETQPISTYLFAFAAGRFEVETFEADGQTMRMLHRETDPDKVARNLDAIFDLHASALDWLEIYTEIPYPFEKFDFVAIPAFQFGGMEHPGAIFYRDRSLFLDETATQRQILGRATLIAHETAHMWFGDLVTMEWFDDVWMKEVFANFMAAKIVNPSFPEINHELAFLLDHYPSAYAVDRTAGANPIRQPLENLNDAGSLYGSIIYDKAPVVMKQLELLMGEERFRDGLREYLDSHRFGNATWLDLIEVLDQGTQEDLQTWSEVWVNEPHRPTIETEIEVDNGLIRAMRILQTDPDQQGRIWTQSLNVLIGQIPVRIPVQLDQSEISIPEAIGLEAPSFVLANGAGIGYGNFRLDAAGSRALLSGLPELSHPVVRAVAWITLWDAMLEGQIAPGDLIDLAIRALGRDDNEQNIQRILSYLEGAYWKYLSSDARQAVAPSVEAKLWERLEAEPSLTVKAAYFETFRAMAITPAGVELLRELWEGKRAIQGLPLSEDDTTALAEELALRGVDESQQILDRQFDQIKNPDRRSRFEFVCPSLSDDEEVRDAFFESLRDPAERKREPWVLEALGYLHHPLRSGEAERYIQPSLEMLEEIQQTGDIFFPLAWLNATFSGHNSQAAASTAQDFLDTRSDLPPRLRGKLLQAADPLFRAAAILGGETE